MCGSRGRVDIRRLLRALHARGVGRLLVEGGGGILGAFLDAGVVDQVAVFLGQRIVGGLGGRTPVAGRGKAAMKAAPKVTDAIFHRFGGDLLVEGYLAG